MHTMTIVVSRTGTVMGKVIRIFTKGYYNHCSIAFDRNYDIFYTFARKYKLFWVTGCFTTETIDRLMTGNELIAKAYEIEITDKEYEDIQEYIKELSKGYNIYNYIGAILILFNLNFKTRKYHICSTFVAYILEKYVNEVTLDKEYYLYKPMDIYQFMEQLDCAVALEDELAGAVEEAMDA